MGEELFVFVETALKQAMTVAQPIIDVTPLHDGLYAEPLAFNKYAAQATSFVFVFGALSGDEKPPVTAGTIEP